MKYIIANWKSNKNLAEATKWFNEFKLNPSTDNKVILAPAFPFLGLVNQLKPANLEVAVQDISPFPAGAYTGAVSSLNLQGLNVKYAIVGHSERRRYFHERHQDVANKVSECLANDITPIVCVDDEYIFDQAHGIEEKYLHKCIVAYEDLAAIGTGDNTPLESVLKVQELIRSVFGQVPVIYGGSVNPGNVKPYLENTDGVLVGGASLDPDKFSQIANY